MSEGPAAPARDAVAAAPSALQAALDRVGDRWTLLLVAALLGGQQRFSELLGALPGLAPNVLSQRLKALERHGLIVSRPYSRRPLRRSYDLSATGRDLAGALRLLAAWGAGAGGDADAPRHATCGTPLEIRWHCPTCAAEVADPEAEDLRFA
ncbi:MAG: helix-turn-helix transcriptional regulator [Actinomycetota bacterium]|nr:helix-turn-helix transcriptional regulator [Actinomycetota bacterium]